MPKRLRLGMIGGGQGAFIGASLGFSIDYIYALVNKQPYAYSYLGSIIFSIVSLIFIRILLEILSISYKTASDTRKYINRRS